MNMVCLLGRLAGEPELRHTQTDVPVASFQLAVERAYTPKGQEKQTDFIPCVAWRNTAEFIARYFSKGHRIAVQGTLQSRNYTGRDGGKRTAYEVVVDNAFFAESKNAGGGTGGPSPAPRASVDFEEIDTDSELPF